MSYQGKKLFRIDLGVIHEPQPCAEHAKATEAREAGYEPGCDACEATPERAVPVPHLAGFWVEVINPDLLSYGRKKEIYTPLPAEPSALDVQVRRERIVAGLVTAWNIEPVDTTDGEKPEVLPLPRNDASALDRAPDIISFVLAGLGREQRRQGQAVPKASATP